MIAMRRKQDVELAAVAGLLHDIYTYSSGDSKEHAHRGVDMAKEILMTMNLFSKEEIRLIFHAIYYHSDKDKLHEPFDEVLKDADVLQHCFYNPLNEIMPHETERFQR